MIRSFRHKGLKQFFETGTTKGIQADHANKLARILDRLDSASRIDDMNLPGFRLHLLEPKKDRIFAVRVSGNWRVTFYFKESDAYIVDYKDYH